MQPVFLLTDLFVYAILLFVIWYLWHVRSDRNLRANWRLAMRRPVSMVSSMVLGFFMLIALTDSVHYREALPASPGQTSTQYAAEASSLLDNLLKPLATARERSYSEPLSAVAFRKETFERDGVSVRDYPRLRFGGKHLKDPASELAADVSQKTWAALAMGSAIVVIVLLLGFATAAARTGLALTAVFNRFRKGQTLWPWRSMAITLAVLVLSITWVVTLSQGYHVFGTDRTGNSVLVFALKSVRTALVIGGLTTLVVLPLALLLGVTAGYLRGWVDEAIQYVYTLLASIPDVLLIAASVLLLQVFIDKNQGVFETSLERADARLFFLCLILGITSFTGLCRLVRGETLKLRELEYIQSARAFGVSTPRVLWRHIVPNLMHLVLINTVMQFSSFVLAEAVLSYVGVGVDPKTASFGVMINTARAELAATPLVWWTLATAFGFMFLIVLSANLLADAVRDAFDPRTRLRSASPVANSNQEVAA
ncbi:MAG: ABC transporter permease [Betaproteobacteria bacterium]|nr:ABC transporter permease [Betaproteobacteria bacterium]